MHLVLLGPPGAGKGTQAVHIASRTRVPHIATGDIFREHVRSATELGAAAQAHMDRGELVPDEIVIGMVTARICQSDALAGFVLDGFPRTVPQAEALDAFLTQADRPLDAVLRFAVSEDLVVDRIVGRRSCPADGTVYHDRFAPPKLRGVCDTCGGQLIQRRDDTEDVVRRRLAEYREKTAPLEAYYANQSILVDIDAADDVEAVTERTLGVIASLASVGSARAPRSVDLTDASVRP